MNINPVNPFSIDDLYDENVQDAKLHLRVQKRNAKKCVTTVSGLPNTFTPKDLKSMLSHLKKKFSCSGVIIENQGVDDNEMILQFTGDQRDNLLKFFVDENIATTENITVHDTQMNNFTGSTVKNYEFERELGRGTFGVTYLGINTQTYQRVAIKTIDLELSAKKGANTKIIDEEVNTLVDLTNDNRFCSVDVSESPLKVHKNIACYYEMFKENVGGRSYAFIVTEFIDGTPLTEFIKNNEAKIPPNFLWPLFVQLANGLKYIHERGYAHRDIKPDNILITPDYVIKYIDFGLACVGACKINAGCSNLCRGKPGTTVYMPPEYFASRHESSLAASQAHDVWSLGVVMFEMANGHKNYPFTSSQIINGQRKSLPKEELRKNIVLAPQFASGYSLDDGRTNVYIMSMLINDWKQRPNADECLFNLLTLVATTVWDGVSNTESQHQNNFNGPQAINPTVMLSRIN